MTAHLEMDRFGRVLIPKKLRDALDLRPGETLAVELEGDPLSAPTVSRRASP
jgi:AbrB family looped-hinge helix DNA binding protein